MIEKLGLESTESVISLSAVSLGPVFTGNSTVRS